MKPWEQWIRQCGLVGLVGLLLVAAAAWLQWQWMPQQQAVLDEMGSQTRGLRHALRERSERDTAAHQDVQVESPQQAWRVLWEGLPPATQRVSLLAAVLGQAKAQGLSVNGVQYQGQQQPWATQGDETLWRQRMVLPVTGRYVQVRAWLDALLREPALSLDALTLQRQDVGEGDVQARVALSLWWRVPNQARAAGQEVTR